MNLNHDGVRNGRRFIQNWLNKAHRINVKKDFSVATKAEVSSKRPVKYKIWSFSTEQCFTSESLPKLTRTKAEKIVSS
jgi:hypothetical protein